MLKKIPDIVQEIRQSIPHKTALEASEIFEPNSALLIDVREPAEFAKQAAHGAINIPRGVIEMKMLELTQKPEQAIFLHCATGARATFAAEQLCRIGYTNVCIITSSLTDVCNVYQ